MRVRIALPLLLAALACSSFRESYREVKNKEMEGEAAPPVEGGEWIGDGEAKFRSAEWKVLAFFLPM